MCFVLVHPWGLADIASAQALLSLGAVSDRSSAVPRRARADGLCGLCAAGARVRRHCSARPNVIGGSSGNTVLLARGVLSVDGL